MVGAEMEPVTREARETSDASFEPLARRLLRTLWSWFAGPPARPSYWLTRFLLLRALAFVYLVAFATAAFQLVPLIGRRGLTPVGPYLGRVRDHFGGATAAFLELPSLFWFDHGDGALLLISCLGALLSALVLAGLTNALRVNQ